MKARNSLQEAYSESVATIKKRTMFQQTQQNNSLIVSSVCVQTETLSNSASCKFYNEAKMLSPAFINFSLKTRQNDCAGQLRGNMMKQTACTYDFYFQSYSKYIILP